MTRCSRWLHIGACGMALLLVSDIKAQTKRSTAPRDPAAIAIAQQVLQAAGGPAAYLNVRRWKATGSVSFSSPTEPSATVSIEATDKGQYREDTTSPSGEDSFVVANGSGKRKGPDGKQHNLGFQSSRDVDGMFLPARILAAALSDTSTALVDRGLQTIDGKQLHEIGIYTNAGASPKDIATNERELFIDPNSMQIIRLREFVAQMFRYTRNVRHEFIYSNVQSVSGIPIPFTVEERLAGQSISTLTLQQVQLNQDIADADFSL